MSIVTGIYIKLYLFTIFIRINEQIMVILLYPSSFTYIYMIIFIPLLKVFQNGSLIEDTEIRNKQLQQGSRCLVQKLSLNNYAFINICHILQLYAKIKNQMNIQICTYEFL